MASCSSKAKRWTRTTWLTCCDVSMQLQATVRVLTRSVGLSTHRRRTALTTPLTAAIDVAGAVFRQLCVLSSAARALLSNDLSESCARLEADGTCPPMTQTSMKLLRDALKKVVDAGAALLPPVEQHVAPHLPMDDESPPVAPARVETTDASTRKR